MTHRVNFLGLFRTSVHVPLPALTETALMGFVQPLVTCSLHPEI